MPVAALVLVETSLPGNLGAAFRVAANFGVGRIELVQPHVEPDDPEVLAWACGALDLLEVQVHGTLDAAAAPYRTLVGTASARGRDNLPVLTPPELVAALATRSPEATALLFGNETRGLPRRALDRCDLVARIPTQPGFPVLNLAQAIAALIGYLAIELAPSTGTVDPPADQAAVNALMSHLEQSLLTIGFLDPVNPQRILRKLRRLLGRAGISDDEIAILHGICRQMEWAANAEPGELPAPHPPGDEVTE
ncbi:MAG: RNA methyltransferase [Acidobacteria bacterium]|nr:RNA methyltransferase [Acidobacteriota bacterium]